MATFIDIDDPADSRLADYVSLRDVNLRKSLEAEQGLFIAEGAKVIRRACEAGYPPRSFLLAPRWIDGLRDLFDDLDVEVYVVSEALAEQVTGFHVHRGALASMCRQTRWSAADLTDARRLVVCEDIVDHTNVGAIIRCAARRRSALPSSHQDVDGNRLPAALGQAGGLVRWSRRAAKPWFHGGGNGPE